MISFVVIARNLDIVVIASVCEAIRTSFVIASACEAIQAFINISNTLSGLLCRFAPRNDGKYNAYQCLLFVIASACDAFRTFTFFTINHTVKRAFLFCGNNKPCATSPNRVAHACVAYRLKEIFYDFNSEILKTVPF